MKNLPPSIFNDVIGPVMRGPSSSHTAAAVRIGRMVRQLNDNHCHNYTVEFDLNGSLATTYHSQCSDLGLLGGLLGLETADPKLNDAFQLADSAGLRVKFRVADYRADHPNTYRIIAETAEGKADIFLFASTGGGMIELREINGIVVDLKGDFYETLLFFDSGAEKLIKEAKKKLTERSGGFSAIESNHNACGGLLNLKSTKPLAEDDLTTLKALPGVRRIATADPVLPVLTHKNCQLPFLEASTIMEDKILSKKQLYELAIQYESARSGMTEKQIINLGLQLVQVMRDAVATGLRGTVYKDRLLGPQAGLLLNYQGRLVGGQFNRRVIAYITAIMETKSAMGVIVAAPTAGSCAALPGTLLAVADEYSLHEKEVVRGLLSAGLIGVFIAARSTFAAEESGCQAECGAASGMAAAALVDQAGGNAIKAFIAASIALQNLLGLVCDPVANRVEVPCLGKNVVAGMNAVAAADMALSGFDPVIPLDQTISALDQVGRLLPAELCCTGKAGLAITPASLALAAKFKR